MTANCRYSSIEHLEGSRAAILKTKQPAGSNSRDVPNDFPGRSQCKPVLSDGIAPKDSSVSGVCLCRVSVWPEISPKKKKWSLMPDHNSFRTCYCTLKDSKRLLLQQASHRILQHYNKVYTHLTKHSVFALSFCFVSFLTCNWLSAKDLQCYLDIPNHQSERPPIDTTSWDDA